MPGPRADYEYDVASGKYTLHFENYTAFLSFLHTRAHEDRIELLRHSCRRSKSKAAVQPYLTTEHFYCARHGSGGIKKYVKKYAWLRKILSKRTGCPCLLTVKTYPGRPDVLARWVHEGHNHPIGHENLKFTRVPKPVRERIVGLLRQRVEIRHIVRRRLSPLGHRG